MVCLVSFERRIQCKIYLSIFASTPSNYFHNFGCLIGRESNCWCSIWCLTNWNFGLGYQTITDWTYWTSPTIWWYSQFYWYLSRVLPSNVLVCLSHQCSLCCLFGVMPDKGGTHSDFQIIHYLTFKLQIFISKNFTKFDFIFHFWNL